jgi:hypothetical protein
LLILKIRNSYTYEDIKYPTYISGKLWRYVFLIFFPLSVSLEHFHNQNQRFWSKVISTPFPQPLCHGYIFARLRNTFGCQSWTYYCHLMTRGHIHYKCSIQYSLTTQKYLGQYVTSAKFMKASFMSKWSCSSHYEGQLKSSMESLLIITTKNAAFHVFNILYQLCWKSNYAERLNN